MRNWKNNWQLAQKYLHYYITASNGRGHGIHSPFVYDFITKVLNDKRSFYAYRQVEALRQVLLKDQTELEVEDFGAGSTVSKTNKRTIASIARHSAKPAKWGKLLFRIVNYYQPLNILELGTSLGLSTAYMAMGNQHARVISCEGSHQVADRARKHFRALSLQNIAVAEGNFNETLQEIVQELPSVDLVFIDGNHRFQPTLNYVHQLLSKTHHDSILILDDIHWSAEMEQAWAWIKELPQVRLTIDLFFVGLVFFKEEFKIPQHFTIRF